MKTILLVVALMFALPALGQDQGKVTEIHVLDWGDYFKAVEKDMISTLASKGVNVKFTYVQPPLSTAEQLADQIGKGEVDIATPGISFFKNRPDLIEKFAGLTKADTPSFESLPKVVGQLAPHNKENKLVCAPIYGGFMNLYFKKSISTSKGFSIFKDPKMKGLYALPKNEPWYLAYLTYEVLGTPKNKRFTAESLKSKEFQDEYKGLVANAGLMYPENSLASPKFERFQVIYGWGFEIPKSWVRVPGAKAPFYMDCLGLTAYAANDPFVRKAYSLIYAWFMDYGNQSDVAKTLGTFNVKTTMLSERNFNGGLPAAENKILNDFHKEVVR